MMAMTISMIPLPLQRRVVSFLDRQTALDFVDATTTTEDILRLKPLSARTDDNCHRVVLSQLDPPYELIYSQVFSGDSMTGDVPTKSERIPIFGAAQRLVEGEGGDGDGNGASKGSEDNGVGGVHTVSLIGRWKDQGWGHRKGRIYVIGTTDTRRRRLRPNNDNCYDGGRRQDDQHLPHHEGDDVDINGRRQEGEEGNIFDGGRIVCKSELASHTFQPLRLDFSPRPGEEYHLWYVVGGGGGHLLMIDDLNIHTLVYEDTDARTTLDAYRCLFRKGLITGGIAGGFGNDDDGDGTDHDINPMMTNERQDTVFYISLLKQICLTIVKMKTGTKHGNDIFSIPNPLRSFLRRYIMATDNASMNATVSICNFYLQFLHHHALSIRGYDIESAFRPSTTDMPSTLQSSGTKEVVLPSFVVMPNTTFEGSTDGVIESAQPCCRLPTIPGMTSKVTLTIVWKQAGAQGVSNSSLFVVEVPVGSDSIAGENSRNVWTSPGAPHEERELEMSFVPEPDGDKVYYVFQQVGAPERTLDGRLRPSFLRLHISSITMQLTVRDDSIESTKRQYENLSNLGALTESKDCSFGLQLFLAAIECLRFSTNPKSEVGSDSLCSAIRFFLEQHGFPIQPASLASLHLLVLSLIKVKSRQSKTDKYNNLNANSGIASAHDRLRFFAAM